MSSDEKKGSVSKIETEKTKISGITPIKSIDPKTLLSEIFSKGMIEQYKQTHRREFEEFCNEFKISQSEKNFEKWARLSLVWNALRYAGLFGINYKDVYERKEEVGSKHEFRDSYEILSDLFSNKGWENKTVNDTYSGLYFSYFDCDESANLFKDVVGLLWPEYAPKVVLLGDSHAGVLIEFEDKKVAFDLTHGSVVSFKSISENPLVGVYANNTISAIRKNGKKLNEDEQISWQYLHFVEEINSRNSLKENKVFYSDKRKSELVSFYKMFFSKPQETLDLIKEMERLYYGYAPNIASDMRLFSTAPLYLSSKEFEFLAERFLTKSNIQEEGKEFFLRKISGAKTIEEKTAILLFALMCARFFVIDRKYAEGIFNIYSSLVEQGKKYELPPLYSLAIISEDSDFSTRIKSGGFNLTQLPWTCQGILYNIVLATHNPNHAKLIGDLVYVDPEMYRKSFVKRLVEKDVNSPEIWKIALQVVERNPSLLDPTLKSSLLEALKSDTLSSDIKTRIRGIVRV